MSGVGTSPGTRKITVADAAQEFEAFVLQAFIQEMLPKNAENVFGRGTAGDIWRSLLSEKFAAELAHRGTLGIAETVRGGAVVGAASLGSMAISDRVTAGEDEASRAVATAKGS
jgi:hypothetical protein